MEQWYILYDIPYQKDFVGYYELQPIDDLQWYILNDIPYQKRFVPLQDITDHPVHSGMWKILTDIPYQEDFQPHHELQPIGDTSWYILNDIPYQKQFATVQDVTAHPTHAGLWKILTDIPYQPEFPEYYALQPLASEKWYILNDIPYKKEFPKLRGITKTPDHADQWHILTDIPYQPKFPDWNALQPFEEFWYILTDIPYKKEFAERYPITEVPVHSDRWYILLDIPYQKAFPQWNALQPLSEQWNILTDIPYKKSFPQLFNVTKVPQHGDRWYILEDIPYQKQFPVYHELQPLPEQWNILTDIPYQKRFSQLYDVTAEPQHSGRWYILEDIPYQKQFPDYYALQPIPELWYILYDIPYQKRFPQLYDITAEPKHSGRWYILEDIPYQKQFPDYYELQPMPELWYILYDIPYQKEFPTLYDISAVPKHPGWYILLDISYRKEFPRLYGITAIPKHYIPKTYMVVGLGAIGRWQIRKCTEYDTENWTLIEDIGPPTAVKAAYIEADGNFDYIAGNDSITLTTTDTPWLAVITSTKKLYVKQVCADIETAILLDTGVEQASLCRGWKSDKYSVDSGLICAYRKADGVYAKVYKKIDGEYVWETLPQLLYEPVDHVEVKRMNDYRIGVYVTNPNRLLLSERFYIGGTSKTEYIAVKLKPWANVCSFSMVGEPAEQTFKVERCWMEEDTKVRMHCNYPIVSFDPEYPNLTLTDDYNYSKLVEYYIQNGDLVCILDKPKYSSFNTIRIVIPSINHILYQITPQFKRTVPGDQYVVENPPIAEYINTTIVLSATTLHMTERMDYSVKSDDYIATTVRVSSTTLSTTEVHNYVNDTTSDIIQTMLVVSGTTLTMTQSGDLPI